MIPNYPFVSVFIGNQEYRSVHFSPAAVKEYGAEINENMRLGKDWMFIHWTEQQNGRWCVYKYIKKVNRDEWQKEAGDALSRIGFSWQVEYEDSAADILHFRLINLKSWWEIY